MKRIWMTAGALIAALTGTGSIHWRGGPHDRQSSIGSASGHVDARQAAELIRQNQDMIVVDVRTPEEFAEGRIHGARNIDIHHAQFKERVGALDRNGVYLIHCRSGHRSSKALKVFEELRFERVYHLDGGLMAWAKAGQPIVR